jgi:hypothetical protein
MLYLNLRVSKSKNLSEHTGDTISNEVNTSPEFEQ